MNDPQLERIRREIVNLRTMLWIPSVLLAAWFLCWLYQAKMLP